MSNNNQNKANFLIISLLTYNALDRQSERLTKAQLRIQVLEIMIKENLL